MGAGGKIFEVRNREERPRKVKLVTGAKNRNKVAVPEGAAGTPPFWRGRKIDKVLFLVLLVLFIQDMIP